MPFSLRLILLGGSLLIIATVLSNIRKKKILISDSTGWVCIAALLLFIAIFPGIVTWLSGRLGFVPRWIYGDLLSREKSR